MKSTTLMLAMVVALAAGCSRGTTQVTEGDSEPVLLPAPSTPPPSGYFRGVPNPGHFRGTMDIGGELFYAEAILTVDGELRVHIGGPGVGIGVFAGGGIGSIELGPAEAALLVGTLDRTNVENPGAGRIIGQNCATPEDGRFCGPPALAEIVVTPAEDALVAAVNVATDDGESTWLLDVSLWSAYYRLPAQTFAGTFSEQLAPFAVGDDTIVTVDGLGRLFFQSGSSNCTGNGAFSPRPPGSYYVFDVTLVIAGCDAVHSYLNGTYEGLATETQNGYWDYDDWLVMLLSTPDAAETPAALAMISYAF